MIDHFAGREIFTGVTGPLAHAKYVTTIWKFYFFRKNLLDRLW
jgi:hypothetical protein